MRRIIKVTSILGIASLVKIFSGLARAKFLAWQLGPAGMGVVGQASMYSAFTVQLCGLNMGIGITKTVSEKIAQGKEADVRVAVNTAATIQLVASIAFIIMVLPFSGFLARFVFSDPKYWIFFVGITLVTPFTVYMTSVTDPVFYGYRKIADFTRITIIYTLLGLMLLFVLVTNYKIEGVFIQILVLSVSGFALSYYFIAKKLSLRLRLKFDLFKDSSSRALLKELFKYGLISFIPSNVGMFVTLYLRGLFMNKYGVEANGFYQVAYAVSAYYLPFVTNGIWGHFYPEMCALKEDKDINRTLNQFIRFALFASTGIAALCIIFRKFMIHILFSGKFMMSYDLLAIQATGDIFFVLFYMFGAALIARKKFKSVLLISTLGYNAVLIAAYYLVSNVFGAGYCSLNVAIALASVILVVTNILYSGFDTGFKVSLNNAALFIKSAILISLVLLIPGSGIAVILIKLGLILIWLFFSATRQEIDSANIAVRSFFDRKRGA